MYSADCVCGGVPAYTGKQNHVEAGRFGGWSCRKFLGRRVCSHCGHDSPFESSFPPAQRFVQPRKGWTGKLFLEIDLLKECLLKSETQPGRCQCEWTAVAEQTLWVLPVKFGSSLYSVSYSVLHLWVSKVWPTPSLPLWLKEVVVNWSLSLFESGTYFTYPAEWEWQSTGSGTEIQRGFDVTLQADLFWYCAGTNIFARGNDGFDK